MIPSSRASFTQNTFGTPCRRRSRGYQWACLVWGVAVQSGVLHNTWIWNGTWVDTSFQRATIYFLLAMPETTVIAESCSAGYRIKGLISKTTVVFTISSVPNAEPFQRRRPHHQTSCQIQSHRPENRVRRKEETCNTSALARRRLLSRRGLFPADTAGRCRFASQKATPNALTPSLFFLFFFFFAFKYFES